MAKGISTTQRTLRELRRQGLIAEVVEKYVQIPGSFGFRRDLFKFIDIIALCPNRGILGVQSCGQDFKAHIDKITDDPEVTPNVVEWLRCGGKIDVYGWRKVKVKRGGKAKIWAPRVQSITLEDIHGSLSK